MPALVTFDTIPQLYTGILSMFEGQNKAALAYKDKKTKEWVDITYEQLREQVDAFTGFLYSHGVRKGDRVAILAENRPEWAIADLATQLLGGVNVGLYTTLPPSQIAYILKDSGAKVLVVSTAMQLRKAEEIMDQCPDLKMVVTMSELKKDREGRVMMWEDALAEGASVWAAQSAEIEPLRNAVSGDDLSAFIYTSGTTGNPKGVMLTHHNFASNAISALELLPVGPTDRHLSFLPLCHVFERLAGYVVMFACGVKISYAESVDAVAKNLPEVKPTILLSVPRVYERVYNNVMKGVEEGSSTKQKIFHWALGVGRRVADAQARGEAPSFLLDFQNNLATKLVFSKLHERLGGAIRFGCSGGAALPKHIGEFFMAAGVPILEGYGLSETSPVLTFNPLDGPRFGTVGKVLPGVTVAIQDVNTKELIATIDGSADATTLSSAEGEIIAKGPNIMKGYWNLPDATKDAIDADGWFHTGDIGKFEDGYLRITDRLKHMLVNKGGKNVYPGPIEEQLKAGSTLVDQVLVIGEGQDFLTALIVPSLDNAKAMFPQAGLTDEASAAASEDVRKAIDGVVKAYSKTAAPHDKVRGFYLVPEPFTVENEMMTPTLKLKRKVIEKAYKDQIDALYGGTDDGE